MFETLITMLETCGLGLFGGMGTGLVYFYLMRSSIRVAVGRRHACGWLLLFTSLRLACIAAILLAVIQQGPGLLVCFMVGFAAARFILLRAAIERRKAEKHAV